MIGAPISHRCRVYSYVLWTLQWFEPSAGELARSVLSGQDGSDAALLPDYNKVIKDHGLIRVGCWAHVMVEFKDALKVQAIKFIKALYKIEDEADVKDFTVQQHQALRQVRSKPLLKQIRKWLTQHLPVVVKQSALGKAMHYMGNEWDTLTVYTTDGRLRLERLLLGYNYLVDNAIRPFVMGAKTSVCSPIRYRAPKSVQKCIFTSRNRKGQWVRSVYLSEAVS